MRDIWNAKMESSPGRYEQVAPKAKTPRGLSDAQIRAQLSPAQAGDYDQDVKDARLETWLSERGREKDAEAVWERRMARAARRGEGPLVNEEARHAVERVFGKTTVVEEIPAAPATEPVRVKVFDGTYTVVSGRDGSHRTLRVRTQKQDSNFKPGQQLVGLLTGQDNENDYRNFGHVTNAGTLQVWQRHEGTDTAKIGAALFSLLRQDKLGRNLAAAGYRVEVSKRCYRCHRVLTHPESLRTGVGPECATRG